MIGAFPQSNSSPLPTPPFPQNMSLLLPPPRCCCSSSPFPSLPCQFCVTPKPRENGTDQSAKGEKMNATGTMPANSRREPAFQSTGSGRGSIAGGAFTVNLEQMKREEEEDSPGAVKQESIKRAGTAAQGQSFFGPEGDEQNGQSLLDQTDIYRELILRHLIADISGTCAKLGLPTELAAWTGDDCRRWVAEMCAQFQLNVPNVDAFANLNGRKMLTLGVEDFQTRFPDGGDTLHAQLQLWKTAFESCGQINCQAPAPGPVPGPNHVRPACYGYSSAQQQQNGCSPPSGWLTPSPNEFGAPSSCSSASQYSSTGPQQFPVQQNYRHNGFGGAQPNPYSAHFSQPSNPKMQQCPAQPHHLGPPSDCSATESISSGQQDDSSSVAEDDLLALHPGDISQQFFTQQPLLPSNFCHFPVDSQFAQMAPQGGQTSHQNSQIQQQQQQRLPGHSAGGTIHLWHFIRELLDQPKDYGGCVRWVDRKEGTFKIESSHHLARYWGIRKNRAAMNYDKLSRSLRQYYKKGIIQKPEKKQRLVYKFMPPYNH